MYSTTGQMDRPREMLICIAVCYVACLILWDDLHSETNSYITETLLGADRIPGIIWKGSYNISKSESLVDRIKENTGMDVTFFYGNKRIMTSALDKKGNRILGSAAEQSDQSSQEIEQIASTLIRDSSLAVESMQSMQQIITSQSESMAETQNIVKEVLGEINSSMQSIKQIKASTRRLEDSRNEVVQAVGELSGIAEENVESTKKPTMEHRKLSERSSRYMS